MATATTEMVTAYFSNFSGIAIRGHSTLQNETSGIRQHDHDIRAEYFLIRHPWLDEGQYPKGRKVGDAELAEVVTKRNSFYGEWNYEIYPSRY